MCSVESEQQLEDKLIQQLQTLGYEYIDLPDETALLANFKTQLERHNGIHLTGHEFKQVLNHLDKGSVFDRAHTLRDKMALRRDAAAEMPGHYRVEQLALPRASGETVYLDFIDQLEWCQNRYQVTRQVTMEGKYQNRYDITLLINGLPLVQVELKRRGLELKEAFNQTNRYQRHSYGAGAGLFQYIQLFVISNGINTKYYANNRKQSFKQTFYWADRENNLITSLDAFSKAFLEKCHLSKMLTQYIVLNQTDKVLMVLRPYQYYAVEAIIDKVKNSTHNGYIWHTTGSGKTLTSFKAAQILVGLPKIHKVVFVVDRKDLDYQTSKEFNAFQDGCVDSTDNTRTLVGQLQDDTPLIVTTIQKLNTAISRDHYQARLDALKDQRIVFIFDECHRSQFGDTHKRITEYFTNYQMFGFTGTPIFVENVASNHLGKRTTKDLFGECLHKYVITDAIRDENVLKFSVEYVGRYKNRDSETWRDIEVEDIDTKELLESDQRLTQIVDYILSHHERKTHNRDFTAMLCVSSVEMLYRYYELFKAAQANRPHPLRIATIFSYTANEDDKDANGMLDSDPLEGSGDSKAVNLHSREKLDNCIADYNTMFGSSFSTKDSQSFYNYYNDIAKQVKERKVDLLLVVNMFLTGFDSKTLNTLYVDKNLKYHGLIQAYSRTNRILNEVKSQGNIICFRNLKQATDDAITLFANKDAKETIILQPYEAYVEAFKQALDALKALAPTVASVNELADENAEFEFIKAFRQLMRVRNVLESFSDFDMADVGMEEQEFVDYRSKYLDLHDKVKTNRQTEKVSILNDVDFELELIHRDEINVAYILQLLAKLKDVQDAGEQQRQHKAIIDLVSGDARLRSKRELIEKFIRDNLPNVPDANAIPEHFSAFWRAEYDSAMQSMCEEEGLEPEKVRGIIQQYLFTEREPLRDDVIAALHTKPKILQRKTIGQRVLDRIMEFVRTYIQDAPE
jgi:type I restriction enzyme R subunit